MSKDYPDWRAAEDYPNVNDTTLLQWAWEFFRRNKSYRNDYNEYRTLIASDNPSGNVNPDTEILNRFYICDPAQLPGETITQYDLRNAGKGSSIKFKYNYFFEEKYRLRYSRELPCPYEANPGGCDCYPDFGCRPRRSLRYEPLVRKDPIVSIGYCDHDDDLTALHAVINLELPIKNQLDEIEKFAKTEIKRREIESFKKRNHIDNYPKYLRAFDARTERVTAEETASILDAEDAQAVFAWVRAAKSLIERDYWKLAAVHSWELSDTFPPDFLK
ncbi:MAG: hypothetical protein EPN21_14275 [Methylococcaceae bacterium]|nr:MAG: hypothetical protein EPN21_14275 [Methylococcaceae bacterium]